MNDLPVLRLTQLLTPEEIKTVQGVHNTHDAGFCPVGVCMPCESHIHYKCCDDEEQFGEERYESDFPLLDEMKMLLKQYGAK